MQRAERARRTRRRIVDAATALFLERGYAGATMRAIAAAAGVALPTVELGFGTKATLLKAAIDVAIAGDDEPVPVLDRAWADAARGATSPAELLTVAAEVIAAATALFLERGYAGATVRAIAEAAGVAVPTVELGFGTKARLLKAAIDVAIAGDDEPVPVLDRAWAETARNATSTAALLAVAAEVIAAAQSRSAGLVLAVFEGGRTDPELAALARELTDQRAGTARWLVDALAALAPPHADAADDLWLLMDPAIFDRLVRHRGWTPERYGRWFARTAHALLYPGRTP